MYYIILLLLVVLSFKYDIRGDKRNKKFWELLILALFVIVAGLRYRIGGDTVEYLDRFYNDYPLLGDFSFEDYPFGSDPLFVLLCSVIKTIGGKFYILQLVLAIFVNTLIFHYFKRHTSYLFTCAFFYFVGFYFIFNTEILRGSLSIVICLYANDFIKNHKWIKGLLLYGLASLFHVQTILIAITPLLFSLKFNKKGMVCLIVAFFASSLINVYLGSFLESIETVEAISHKGAFYNDAGEFTSSATINYFIVAIIPYLCYIFFCVYYLKKSSLFDNVKEIEPYLMLGVIFYVMLFNVGIINRYIDYYRVYFAILYAEVFVSIAKRGGKKILNLAHIRALALFIPMLLLQIGTFTQLGDGVRYNPYSSVIEKSIDAKREKYYSGIGLPSPRPEEY